MNFPDIYTQIQEVAAGYNYNKPPDFLFWIQSMIERGLRALNDFLSMFNIHMPGLTDSRMASNLMQAVLVLLGIVSLGILLIYFAKKISSIKRARDRTKVIGPGSSILLTAKDWQEEADRLASSKQWREACRALYFSFLRTLHERDILQFSATRTNYEYFYALTRKKQLAAIFKNLVGMVEAAWFGNFSPDQKDYEECKRLVAQAVALPEAQKQEATS
jgi:Domain of unknown function (DUF4129)